MSTTKRSRSGSKSSTKKRTSTYKTPGQIVKVQWGDAHSTAGWNAGPHAPEIVWSVGHVVQHDKVGISLAKGMSDGPEGKKYILGHSFIPVGMIQEITVLE